ncbi:hypothetical protein J7E88_05400 [Streptomyces sp. ISL-10]|uniref:hypothetical protein n=1 Tax=Streptomyces sp. ISL-10 TaxID=2819172 RepID=UPI001BEB6793|nr:hypothetical protein [Streptomyces sp. ISL-10]MBT2364767.1 hypothetical protein [Streptomyces sp. ISL-10]
MGIESDQLVYDYLSRVGDLAQQAQLPSSARMRLVTSLRGEIDRQRGRFGGESPAAVRRILGRLGAPEAVVAAAAEGSDAPSGPAPSVTSPPPPSVTSRPSPLSTPNTEGAGAGPGAAGRRPTMPRQRGWRRIPRPRTTEAAPAPAPQEASPPHLAGMDELGPSGSEPDWWRIEPGPFGAGERVAGFVGGVEVPEILKPPPVEDAESDPESDPEVDPDEVEAEEEAVPARRRWLPRLRRRRDGERGPADPFLLLAAALLLVGAVLGSLLPLAGGWLLAYGSRRLSATQSKLAVVGLPGAAAAAGVVWLWGRVNGRWGTPISDDGMREALTGTWPWMLKGAAVASALYLLWRGTRGRRG